MGGGRGGASPEAQCPVWEGPYAPTPYGLTAALTHTHRANSVGLHSAPYTDSSCPLGEALYNGGHQQEPTPMPRQYEAIRDKLAKGAPVDSPAYNAAQSSAAAIYNAKHPGAPVTGRSEGPKKPRKKRRPKKEKTTPGDFDFMKRKP